MGRRDFANKHKYDCQVAGYALTGDRIKRGFKSWPVVGTVAEFEHGANIGSRVTLTRVALTGIFALGLKKDRNKVYVAIQMADGEQLLIETKAKDEKAARTFATNVNQAAAHFA